MAICKYPPIILGDEAPWSVSLDLDQLNPAIGNISKVAGFGHRMAGCALKPPFYFIARNFVIFLAGALCICFGQQFFKSQAKGRHAFDPKNAWVDATGESCLKEFFHVFAFPPLVDFATLFMVTVSPSDYTFFLIPSSTYMRYHRQAW